ncbi:MAG: oxygen-independent coproporphyrinogen III oxidase [Pseudomonadota bacterium]
MKHAWRKYLGATAPRYTSYPSALHFDESVTAQDYAKKISEIGLYEPISLYVHIPFCRQLCWYCGCNMRVENFYARAQSYVDALIEEIKMIGRLLNGRAQPTNVHFGGGTPNYLLCHDLDEILTSVEREIGLTDSADLAIELDPRLLRDADIDQLAALGFSRFSLGIQDFDPDVQSAINRMQSFELIEACVAAVRASGIEDLSFDILYGLPKQSVASFRDTLEKALSLGPDRISVFGYAHLPKALPRQRMIDPETLPGDDLRGELAALADRMLIEAGFCRIGFDHYAKAGNSLAKAAREGRLKRNFQGFTDDASTSLIGLGASAISFVDGLYAQNDKAIDGYMRRIKDGELPVVRGLQWTKREALIADTIGNLLCTMRADVGKVLRVASPHDAVRMCSNLEKLETDGLIRWQGDVISIAEGAHSMARIVAAAIDPYAQPNSEFARAV